MGATSNELWLGREQWLQPLQHVGVAYGEVVPEALQAGDGNTRGRRRRRVSEHQERCEGACARRVHERVAHAIVAENVDQAHVRRKRAPAAARKLGAQLGLAQTLTSGLFTEVDAHGRRAHRARRRRRTARGPAA